MQRFSSLMAVLALCAPITAVGDEHPSPTPVPGQERAATTSYALVKRPLLPVIRREELAHLLREPYPNRGIILGRRGLGGVGDWTVVDFDRLTIERFSTGQQGLPHDEPFNRVERILSVAAVNILIEEANKIWNPPAPPLARPRLGLPDSSCDVVLLDERDVLYDHDLDCPAQMEHLIELIHRTEASAFPR